MLLKLEQVLLEACNSVLACECVNRNVGTGILENQFCLIGGKPPVRS
jgi:hypothetical protein